MVYSSDSDNFIFIRNSFCSKGCMLHFRLCSLKMASDDRRHQTEEKTYAVFSADSIKMMADSVGLSSIPHDAAVALGEDASYRMRQVIMVSIL